MQGHIVRSGALEYWNFKAFGGGWGSRVSL